MYDYKEKSIYIIRVHYSDTHFRLYVELLVR